MLGLLVGLAALPGCTAPDSNAAVAAPSQRPFWLVTFAQAPSTAAAQSQPATRPAGSQPASRPSRTYTAPGEDIQQYLFLGPAVPPAGYAASAEDNARKAGESMLGRPELRGSIAAAGGAAGQTAVFNTVGSRGLSGGAALGGATTPNLFTARPNPVRARCTELVGAGFFPNTQACQTNFRR
jgi:hypothetical protein